MAVLYEQRHFNDLAECIQHENEPYTCAWLCVWLGRRFADDNPRFKVRKWVDACAPKVNAATFFAEVSLRWEESTYA